MNPHEIRSWCWAQSFRSLFTNLSQYRFGNEHRDSTTGLWMVRGSRE